MTEREKQPHKNGSVIARQQPARDDINRGDMVRIQRVAQAECPGHKSRGQQAGCAKALAGGQPPQACIQPA